MNRHLVRRLVEMAIVLVGASIVVWLIIHLIPGDPVSAMMGFDTDPSEYQRIKHEMGLDQPVLLQYLGFVGRVLRGDFGRSIVTSRPIIQSIVVKLPATYLLLGVALLLGMVAGVAVGCISALKRNSIFDNTAMMANYVAISLPNFWFGLILILIFAVKLGWLPASGRGDPPDLAHVVLPALAGALPIIGSTAALVRATMSEVLSQEYIRTAWAKGLPDRLVVFRHALRNVMIPIVTTTGIHLGRMLGGNLILEVVFGWPGMGTFIYDAIQSRDYPVIQISLLVVVLSLIVVNLLVDLSYTYLDPRIRYAK